MIKIDYAAMRVTIRIMSEADFENLAMDYCVVGSDFGPMAVAFTPKGICALEFIRNASDAEGVLRRRFPVADMREVESAGLAVSCGEVALYLHGTEFQHEVWRALLTIPYGHVATYGDIARSIGRPSASRAVGLAIGRNPVALLIPCHRVVPSGGGIGGYYWGAHLKRMILEYEKSVAGLSVFSVGR